jgi:hypothetical protein
MYWISIELRYAPVHKRAQTLAANYSILEIAKRDAEKLFHFAPENTITVAIMEKQNAEDHLVDCYDGDCWWSQSS